MSGSGQCIEILFLKVPIPLCEITTLQVKKSENQTLLDTASVSVEANDIPKLCCSLLALYLCLVFDCFL